jgi:hypothetical protein
MSSQFQMKVVNQLGAVIEYFTLPNVELRV